jgi:hypothetical protein
MSCSLWGKASLCVCSICFGGHLKHPDEITGSRAVFAAAGDAALLLHSHLPKARGKQANMEEGGAGIPRNKVERAEREFAGAAHTQEQGERENGN